MSEDNQIIQPVTLAAEALIGSQLYPAGTVLEATAEAVALGIDRARKQRVREQITAAAGDTDSILGTTSDVATAALLGVAHLVVLLGQKGSVDVKGGIASSPIPVDLAEKLLKGVADQTIKLPLLAKGLTKVFEEMIARNSATVTVLEHANQAAQDKVTQGQ